MPAKKTTSPLDARTLKAAAVNAGFADIVVNTAETPARVVFVGYNPKEKADMFDAAAMLLREAGAAQAMLRSIETSEGRCVVARVALPPAEEAQPSTVTPQPSTLEG